MNNKPNYSWSDIPRSTTRLTIWLLSLCAALIALKLSGDFLNYNEQRDAGIQLNDWVLNMLTPKNIAIPLFAITWLSIVTGVLVSFTKTRSAMYMLWSIVFIVAFRCFIMYLFPLLPPEGIIPLEDPIVEFCFYSDKVLVKDLFFSGHTANVALVAFVVPNALLKRIVAVAAVIVAFLLLVQHVHYTIDVIAAPFFSYLSYKCAQLVGDRLLKV